MVLSCGNPTTSNDGPDTGTVTDIDGNTYKTVTIGNQVWMAENLRTTRYNDGTPIPHIKDSIEWGNATSGAYCYYDNDSTSNAKKYGALYNWYVVNTGKLAPEGWHVPTEYEWEILENYLIYNGYNYDGTTDSNKVAKSMAAKTDWYLSDEEGDVGNDLSLNNSSGFSGLPGASRANYSVFINLGYSGRWWTATEQDIDLAHSHFLFYTANHLCWCTNWKKAGHSIRLVRD